MSDTTAAQPSGNAFQYPQYVKYLVALLCHSFAAHGAALRDWCL